MKSIIQDLRKTLSARRVGADSTTLVRQADATPLREFFVSPAIEPGATLGVLGGGQLARMFVHAATKMGYRTAVLEPDANSPAAQVSQAVISTAYDDVAGLDALANQSAAITTEFENVPAQTLAYLNQRCPVRPNEVAVQIAQDRAREKTLFTECGLPCAPYLIIDNGTELTSLKGDYFPAILKTARLGYDGKGQVAVKSLLDLTNAWRQLKSVSCVLEKRLQLDFECSVILARSEDGSVVYLPTQRNVHVNGILDTTTVFAGNVPAKLEDALRKASQTIAEQLGYVGVLCVEFFIEKGGQWRINEIAPRPHNSGHYSIDACDVSQFELQVRTLAGLPLVTPQLLAPAIMINLLGDLWLGPQGEPRWSELLQKPGVHLHLYGKSQARAGRKMGHITLTAVDVPTLRTLEQSVKAWLKTYAT